MNGRFTRIKYYRIKAVVPGIFQAMQGEDFLSRFSFSVLFSDTAENVTDFLALRSEARAKMSV